MELALYNRSDLFFENKEQVQYAIKLKKINPKDLLLTMLIFLAIIKTFDAPLSFPRSYEPQESLIIKREINFESEQANVFSIVKSSMPIKISETAFLEQRQLLVSKHLIEHGVSSLCFLENEKITAIHHEIAKGFRKHLISQNKYTQEQISFLSEDMIILALNMQNKYQIPASVLISKAITQSDWGRLVYEKNLFQVVENNDLKSYDSYAAAFEDFSKKLTENPQFASLFVGGKDYKSWTDKLGKIVCNDSIFAPTPNCYNKMGEIIKSHHLDLLDF